MTHHEPDPGNPTHPDPGVRRDDSARTTPAADLQAEDADSGNTPAADPGDRGHTGEHPRAERAMKQQGKTDHGR